MAENEEQENEGQEIQPIPVEDLFVAAQESFADAQQRAIEENKSFARTEFFRMDKFGTYNLRVLPIAPSSDGTATRLGYEFPIHQMLMELEKPSKGTKAAVMYVTAPNAVDAGHSVDLIDTYRKLAVAKALELDDEKLAEKIGGGSFGGGLKYNYGHVVYVFDINERAKGLQLLTLSHSQFKDLDERKFKLWQKKLAKNPNHPCPISSVHNAYPLEIEKKKNGSKTEYAISIDNESDYDVLSKEELTLLLNAPRISEVVNRYLGYHLGATIEFLKQCDIKYSISIFESDEIKEVIEKLQSELPADDKSSFSFEKRKGGGKSEDETETGEMSLDDLFDRLEELEEKKLGDKTEEGQELRGNIRAYIEQEKLGIRVTRSTSNRDLLDLIEEALNAGPEEPEEPEEPKEVEEPEKVEEAEEPEAKEGTRRRRR